MTVVMITNLVLSIAMVKNTNLDILISKKSSLSPSLSFSLSLPSDGIVGFAVSQRL